MNAVLSIKPEHNKLRTHAQKWTFYYIYKNWGAIVSLTIQLKTERVYIHTIKESELTISWTMKTFF